MAPSRALRSQQQDLTLNRHGSAQALVASHNPKNNCAPVIFYISHCRKRSEMNPRDEAVHLVSQAACPYILERRPVTRDPHTEGALCI